MADRDLKVTISGDASDLDAATKQAEGSVSRLKGKIQALGAEAQDLLSNKLTQLIGLAAIGKYLKDAGDASDALAASMRKLEATARITGTPIEVLQQIADRAQQAFKLSTASSNDFAIELVKLAAKAGDLGKAAPALQAFLDLGAAKGLTASETLQALQQAILGIDEGTDKLFNKNPSVLYAEYGASIGKTAAALTDQEKAQALLTAALNDGGKVLGQYATFLDSAAGKQEQMATAAEQASARLGKAIEPARVAVLGGLAALAEGFQAFIGGLQAWAVSLALIPNKISAFMLSMKGVVLESLGAIVQGFAAVSPIFRDTLNKVADDLNRRGAAALKNADKYRADLEQIEEEAALEITGIQTASYHKREQAATQHTAAVAATTKDKAQKVTAEEKKLTALLEGEAERRRQADLKNIQTIAAAGAKLREAQGKDAEQAQKDFDSVRAGLEKVFGPVVLDLASKTDVALSKLIRDANDLYLAGKLSADQRQRIVTYVEQHRRVLSDLLPDERQSADLAKYVADLEKERAKAAGETAQQHDKLRESIVSAARGALEFADAFGVISDEAAKTLNSVLNIGENLGKAIAGDPTAILAVAGSLANALSGLGSSPELAEARRLSAQNTQALDRLTREVGNLDLGASGNTFTATKAAIDAALAAATKAGAGTGVVGDARGAAAGKLAFFASLASAGVSRADALQLMKDLGIQGFDSTSAPAFLQALGFGKQALGQVEFGQFGQGFQGQKQFTEAAIGINGSDTFQQFAAYASLFSRFSPGLAGALGDVTQFNTAAGRQGLLGQIQALLQQLQTGALDASAFGDLSGSDFLDALTTIKNLIDAAGDATGTLQNADTLGVDSGNTAPEGPTTADLLTTQTDVFSEGFATSNDYLAQIAQSTSALVGAFGIPGLAAPGTPTAAAAAVPGRGVILQGDIVLNMSVAGASDPLAFAETAIDAIDRALYDRLEAARAVSGSASASAA